MAWDLKLIWRFVRAVLFALLGEANKGGGEFPLVVGSTELPFLTPEIVGWIMQGIAVFDLLIPWIQTGIAWWKNRQVPPPDRLSLSARGYTPS